MAVVGNLQYNTSVDPSGLQAGLKQASTVAVTAFAAIAAAGAAATAGLVKSSIESYAQYEQLSGGVEILFKQNAEQVKTYAENAYATAGLSANQYMETVTSFSGTLLRGLGGDTAAAARIADVAIQDMADNAATFGTSISVIQDTYASIARGNFEMLDNLKLGFAGTQQGMADLINSSGVMGAGFVATAENIKNIPFDKYIAAIHQVQLEQGITGQAAREASLTITGSVNATKAAWENLLIVMASGNEQKLQPAIDKLVEFVNHTIRNVTAIIPSIVTAIASLANTLVTQLPVMLQAIIPAFTNIMLQSVNTIIVALPQFINAAIMLVMAIVEGIAKQAPVLIPQIINMLAGLVNTILNALPQFITAAIQIIIALIQGLTQQAPLLIPQIVNAIGLMLNAILQQLPLLIQSGILLLVAVIQGLSKALPQLIGYVPLIINTIVTTLTTPSMLNLLIHAAWDIMFAVVKGIIQSIPQVVSGVKQIGDNIERGIRNIGDAMNKAGADLVIGLWNGISSKAGWVLDKVKSFGKSITDGLKSFFGIKSPSRLFRDEIGKNLALGIGVGFSDTIDSVTADMQSMLPSSSFDINAAGEYGASQTSIGPTTVIVKVGEETLATKIIDAINDKSMVQGFNVIKV